jgi:hypothetical protein
MGPLAQLTHLQFSVVAMTALLWICQQLSLREGATGAAIPAKVLS